MSHPASIAVVAALLLASSCKSPSPPPSPSPSSFPSPSSSFSPSSPPQPTTSSSTASALPAPPLVADERDQDPRSETVTIKIIIDPRRKARVTWGRKDLGLAPLEIQRPRNSGPLDLVVQAPGYLTLHTRAFTDRDDKLALRLFTEEEGTHLLGYTRIESTPAPRPRAR